LEGLLDVSEAQQRLLEAFSRVEKTQVPLKEAVGRVLAEDIYSGLDLPPFANSSMDGFAVRIADTAGASRERPAVLRVAADIPAGTYLDTPIQAGEAFRIMTGAPLPPGGEAVIQVEDTSFTERQAGIRAPEQVEIYRPVEVGENIRPSGQDVREGELILPAGILLRAQDIGLLAMLGQAIVPVYRRPQIGFFSTGDELLPVEEPLTPGTIHDSNAYILASLVTKYGGEPINLGIARDRTEDVIAVLERAVAEKVDLILSSAGVSVGAFDYVRTVIEQGGGLSFWRVNMRPGKPLAFGEYQGLPFIGLPGNPVSAFVGFEVFVRPALLKMAGLGDVSRPTQRVILDEMVQSDGRESYLRAVVEHRDGVLHARLTGHQGSGNLRSLVQANALLILPSGVKSLPIGSESFAWILDDNIPGFLPG
jgi:molybdopterin molybdotransferase